jgi:RNA polymerase sigma factor (sigma-70 family)
MARMPDLLPRYLRRTKSILMRRGTRREDAEDLIQEAFIKMQQYCEKGGEVHQPEGFLVRTALRLAVNAHRDGHLDLYVDKEVEELTLLIDTNPAPDEELAADECLMRMRAALDGLNARSKEVFCMHRLDGLTQPQIAQHFRISVSAVEKHIATALAALAEASLRE